LDETVAKKYDVEVMTGKANLEVRPRFVNKGEIAKRLILEYGDEPPEFVLCLGDDFTDEGMLTCLDTMKHCTDPPRHVSFAAPDRLAHGSCLLCDGRTELEADARQLASP
jgi:trehalose 6-phosphate synthase/phosphatase